MIVMRKKLTIIEMHNLAEERGGNCLSEKYVNARIKLIWQCKKSHIWEATPYHVKRGQWCPKCARVKKLSIKDMQKIAEEKGGKCLSEKYINVHHKLIWQCKKEHIWKAIPSNVKKGHWCPKCAIKRITNNQKSSIEEMYKLAENQDGKCLSKKYVNARSKLTWECKEGHIWRTKPDHIMSGHWCPKCAGIERLSIEDMHKLAENKDGECISKNYINAQTKLKWRCKDSHIWETTPNKIKSGRWCPICSEGVSERICRQFFEYIFNKKFPKKKFKWLVNKEGNQMELDGYNRELKLGFEYQGRQHYIFIPHFHHNKETFKKRLEDDRLKKELSKLKGINLIEVPYTIDYDKMQDFIISQCKMRNINIPNIESKIDFKEFNVFSKDNLSNLKKIAKKREGICLSKEYINARSKLKWQCKEGHIWEAIPDSIKRGSWCRKCSYQLRANQQKLTIEEMHKLAEEREGKCLSEKYNNVHHKLIWQCKKGHIWKAIPSNVKTGHWCPICGHN